MDESALLQVPGAGLRYEVHGSGPVLLLIVGGNGDPGVFGPLANELADRYTVVSYVRRGFSGSPLDGPVADERIATDSDDAHRLLAHLTSEPAHVFGSSSAAEYVASSPRAFRNVTSLMPNSYSHWRQPPHGDAVMPIAAMSPGL